MKYEDKLIAKYQDGPDKSYGSTMYRNIFEIGKYWVVFGCGACGQTIFVFLKDEVKDQKKNILVDFDFPKNISRYTTGWYQYYESLEEAIDRDISEFEHPNQLVWYEERELLMNTGEIKKCQRVTYSIDTSEENRKRIESSPYFFRWTGSDGY